MSEPKFKYTSDNVTPDGKVTADPAPKSGPELSSPTEIVEPTIQSGAHKTVITDLSQIAFLRPPRGPDEIGRLGGYRVLKKLGEGGMGIVFEAEDIQLKRRVALKVMKPQVAANERHRQRFIREAQAAAAVEHDNICPIYQVGEDHDVPFIAMQLLKGESLDARLEREKMLPISECIHIGRALAEGLAAAHRAGLVHRDVKPGNIWLLQKEEVGASKDGKKITPKSDPSFSKVKVLDFGLARPASDQRADGQAHITQSGAILGTPAYMAPEQGRGNIDHRADLFSMGVVLYEMTTGCRPFKGDDTMTILTSLAVDEPAAPNTINDKIPKALSDLILELLAKAPEDRPSDGRLISESLLAVLSDSAANEASFSAQRPSAVSSVNTIADRSTTQETRASRRWLALAIPLLLLVGSAAVYFGAGDKEPAGNKEADKNKSLSEKDTPAKIGPPGIKTLAARQTRTNMLVPAYFYPAGDGLKHWDQLFEAAPRAPIVAIVNPASGPGKEADPNYTKIIERGRESPIVLLGYVTSSYAKRPLAEVKADIDVWMRLYPDVLGIFVDEQASAEEHLQYYESIYKHIREQHKFKIVITNPGVACSEKYFAKPAIDVACLFEGPRAVDVKELPRWLDKQGWSRAAILAYKAPTAERMRQSIAAAAEKKVGFIYITDTEGANPWDRLPSYWKEEVAEVEKLNNPKKN